MGRKSRKRDRRRRKKKAKRRGPKTNRFSVALTRLDLAKGHDGLLRGAPEPVVLLGAYVVHPGGARLLSRITYHVKVPNRFPCQVEPRNAQVLASNYRPVPPSGILVVGVALEEDNGAGVRNIYADLESAAELALLPQAQQVPHPVELVEVLEARATWQDVHRVDLMRDSQYLSERCTGDKWVGACAFMVPTEHRRTEHLRMHFVSADQRNDWTAELAVHN